MIEFILFDVVAVSVVVLQLVVLMVQRNVLRIMKQHNELLSLQLRMIKSFAETPAEFSPEQN